MKVLKILIDTAICIYCGIQIILNGIFAINTINNANSLTAGLFPIELIIILIHIAILTKIIYGYYEDRKYRKIYEDLEKDREEIEYIRQDIEQKNIIINLQMEIRDLQEKLKAKGAVKKG